MIPATQGDSDYYIRYYNFLLFPSLFHLERNILEEDRKQFFPKAKKQMNSLESIIK